MMAERITVNHRFNLKRMTTQDKKQIKLRQCNSFAKAMGS